VKKKDLEILLQKMPSFDKPSPSLEQYLTPASIVADILFIAHQFGDVKNKIVLDLGCGTGIFSVGAALTGAKKVVGVDIDKSCIEIAREHAKKNNLEITYVVQDAKDVKIKCDTVIMNPPFEKGFEVADVIYSIHLAKTVPFIKKLVSALGGEIDYSKDYIFPIKWMYEFHEKRVINYDVTMLRIVV
jgi:putative methylase